MPVIDEETAADADEELVREADRLGEGVSVGLGEPDRLGEGRGT